MSHLVNTSPTPQPTRPAKSDFAASYILPPQSDTLTRIRTLHRRKRHP